MVLYRKNRTTAEGKALICAVKQRNMGLNNPGGQTVMIDDKAVVLAGNFDLACNVVAHGVIGPPVAQSHFFGFGPQSQGEQLMPQTNTKQRQVALHQKGADHGEGIGPRCRRVAGAVG